MCNIKGVRLFIMIFSWIKLVFCIYIFSIGCYFASSDDLQQAFGVEFLSYGLSLIFLGLLSMGVIFPFKYGINRHNRFILMVSFVFETIVFAEMINLGLTVQSYTYPVFSKSLQLDCLRNTPLIYTEEECAPFFDSDRTAGFRLFWDSYFTQRGNKFSFQVLSTIEGGLCCGFFPPFKCRANDASFPKNRKTTGIDSSLTKARVTCSTYDNYYPEQTNCIDYIDFAADPPLVGGCVYDLGISFCLNNDIQSSSLGCASATEDYVVALISPHAPIILGCCVLNMLYMIIACCMWWKRKETDVFPDFLTENKVIYYTCF